MKKYLLYLLLLFSVGIHSQVLQNPTYGTVSIKSNTKQNDANRIVAQDSVSGKLNWILRSSLTTPDATTTVKGKVKLAGDLSGTADLPTVPGKTDKGGYSGTSQDLKTAIDNIYQPDVLISATAPSRSVNTFTFPANGYTALINKVIRTNPASLVTTIDVAATDFKRVDLIYFKSDNTLAKIVGVESQTVAIRPDVPANSVPVSFVNVFGNVISDPTPVTQEISIQDSQGVERFKIDEYIRFKGASFNSAAKQIEIDPLQAGVIFVSNTGNDSTGEPENRNKPYLTLNKAIDVFFANPQIVSINIVSASTFTISRNLNNATTRTFTLNSEVACTVNITYNGIYGYLSQLLNFNLLSGTLNFAPTTSASFGNNANRVFAAIKVKNISNNTFFGDEIIGGLTIDAENATVTGAKGFVGACASQANNYYKIKNINFVGFGARLFSAGNFSNNEWLLDFDNITHDSTFNISCWSNKLNINHGNISGSYSSWVDYCQAQPGTAINIQYKTGAVITSNLGFGRFNAGGLLTLTGVVNYSNTDMLLRSVNVENTLIINANITCKSLAGDRLEGTVFIQNSTIKVTSSFAYVENNIGAFTYTKPLFSFEGACYIIGSGLATNFDLLQVVVSIPTTNKPYVSTINSVLYTNGKFNRANIDIIEAPMNQYYDTTQRQLVLVDEKQEIVNKDLDPTKTYVINGKITLVAGEYIRNSTLGTTIQGYGYDTSGIEKNVAGEAIIISPAGNSGNLTLSSMYFKSGSGSVFNLTDSDGSHAIEINDVNFNSCSSLGVLNGYRQLTATTCGVYSCSDGFTFNGNWTGVKITNSNIIGFGSSGTLFKKGASLVFSNRFYADLNIQVATGSKICDFADANFTNDKSLQIVNNYVKVNGVIDPTTTATTFPNISQYSTKAYFLNNQGIYNSRYVVPDGVNSNEAVNKGQLDAAVSGAIAQTISSASTLTLSVTSPLVSYYEFSGSTATWTLPVPAGNTTKKLSLINTGTGTVTVNSNTSALVIYSGGLPLVNTYSLLMGSNVELYSDGIKWIVL